MPMIINGIGVSRGVSQGRAYMLDRNLKGIKRHKITEAEVEQEIERIRVAREKAKEQLKEAHSLVPDALVSDLGSFIDTHLMMLDDAMLTDQPPEIIRNELCNAEWALQETMQQVITVFDSMDDPYLRTRKDDVEHVIKKIQENLAEGADEKLLERNRDLTGCIVIADDLTPADTVFIQHQNVAGFITAVGSTMSHTAILARSLQIPAIVGIHDAKYLLDNGETLLVDGSGGTIMSAASDLLINQYRIYQRTEQERHERLMELRDKPALTRDHQHISLKCNIDLVQEVDAVHEVGAAGVGLYRTEFFYINRDTEATCDEQYEIYREMVHALDGKPLTIRTLDLGADKEFDPTYRGVVAPNPALGLRAIRRSLQNTSMFLNQLRAILRASAHGPVKIMLPMLTNAFELTESLKLLEKCKQGMEDDNVAYDSEVQIGAMIEVPAAALSAATFARRLDFLSIGTNDLIQYTLAIDRVDDQVHYLFDPLHPAVLQLIHHTIMAAVRVQKPVGMCGEMAGNPKMTRLLVGLGLREFSTNPSLLPEIKQIIRDISFGDVREKAEAIMNSEQPEQINEMVHSLNSM